MGTPMALIEQLRGDELASLRSEVASGRQSHILKSLDERGGAQELVRQQYTGRYPFELLQNANDAAGEDGRPGRARFVLTDSAVVVADDGAGFGPEQIRAICGLGRSSKDPRKSVGYKGLGFKSVNEITARPQIISGDVAFGFDEKAAVQMVEEVAGRLDERQRLPVYAFPVALADEDLGDDDELIRSLRGDGFTTVLRLPLRQDVARTQVEGHLVDTLQPRLLLFLAHLEELELRGTMSDFRSVVSRESGATCDEVLLDTDGELEHWLVYRQEQHVDQSLVSPLGPAWAEVTSVHVAVAVPLGPDGSPSNERVHPLHVYFPTEERTGLSVILQGDFALQLDRRQVATTPEALPYNRRLIEAAATLVGSRVAPDLALRFPGDPRALSVLAPRTAATDLGDEFLGHCVALLRDVPCVPCVDGQLRTPREAVALPDALGHAERTHLAIDMARCPSLVVSGIETDDSVRAYVRRRLGVGVMTLLDVLEILEPPSPSEARDFYRLLVDWSNAVGQSTFAPLLGDVPCVLTTTGTWLAPSERVFFPRQRDDVEIPVDLPVPIAVVPQIDGLQSLLGDAGVRSFEWRELILHYLLPILISPEAEPPLRDRAMEGLRSYHASQRGGDPLLQPRLQSVLLPARTADGDNTALRPAGSIYFSAPWMESNDLEILYGPFGEAEFLAVPPTSDDQLDTDRAFYESLGVSAVPRVLVERADQRDTYLLDSLQAHPHRALPQWVGWWNSESVKAARRCPQGHPQTQRLLVSSALDRFDRLAAEGDPERLWLLWRFLARHWAKAYEPATRAVFHCQHRSHTGPRDREAPSLFAHAIEETAWIPALLGGTVKPVRPREAWRPVRDLPLGVASRVALLDAKMLDADGIRFAAALGVVDAARPAPHDLVALLEDLAEEHGGADSVSREVERAARWAMRALDDSLRDGVDGPLKAVPLLARHGGRDVFVSNPVITEDRLLADSWEPHYPILSADRDLRYLHRALGLRSLDDPDEGVRVVPRDHGVRHDKRAEITQMLTAAKPSLAALAIVTAPSQEGRILRGLSRLEFIACDDLELTYEFDRKTLSRREPTSHLAVRQESGPRGGVRDIATAHLEIDPRTGEPDWYSLGPQLARFIGVPTLGDAFATLLSVDGNSRRRFLTSRNIDVAAVEDAARMLQLPPEDDQIEHLMDFLPHDNRAGTTPAPNGHLSSGDEPTPPPPEPETPSPSRGETDPDPAPTPPPLDLHALHVIEVAPSGVNKTERQRNPVSGGRPGGHTDWERQAARHGAIGRRGEEAAFNAERNRVSAFGDPDQVVWHSLDEPTAPYDIRSVDPDGTLIYIEVKSTPGDDPRAPFLISESELTWMMRYGPRYCIYRVTKTDETQPEVRRYVDPASMLSEGRARLRLADARMAFGADLQGSEEGPVDETATTAGNP